MLIQSRWKTRTAAALIVLPLTGIPVVTQAEAQAQAQAPWSAIESKCGDFEVPAGETRACAEDRALARRITHRKLQRTACESPKEFCSEIRALKPDRQFRALIGPSCETSAYTRNLIAISASISAPGSAPGASPETAWIGDLTLAAAQALPAGEAGLEGIFTTIRSQVEKTLTTTQPPAPPAVIQVLRNTRLVTSHAIHRESLEVQEGYRSICGLPGLPKADGSPGEPAGILSFNAFQYDGAIYTCPQMELNWLNGDIEGAAFTLAHELAHAVSLDTLGTTASKWADPADDCVLKREKLSDQQIAIVDHLQTLKPMHDCLAREEAFIDGRNNQVLATIHGRALNHSNPEVAGTLLGCEASQKQLRRSENWGEGLTATQDTSSWLFTSASLTAASDRSKFAKVGAMMRLGKLRLLPHHNQFQETYADVIAIRALPGILARFRGDDSQRLSKLSAQEQQFSLVRSLTFLCEMQEGREKARDVHPIDFRRLDLILASPEVREDLGCSEISPGFKPGRREQRIAGCMGF